MHNHNTGRSFDRVHGTKDLIDTIFVKAIRIFLFHYDILQIFQKLRDYEYNEQMMRLYVMGGGARIVEAFGEYDMDRVTFDHDIRANAKGYEYYCYMILKHQQRKKAM